MNIPIEVPDKNGLILEVAQLSVKQLRNGSLTKEERAKIDEILKQLGMSFEEVIKEAQKILLELDRHLS